MAKEKRYSLGKNGYRQKPVSNELINAIEKIKNFLQEEENRKFGRNSQEVSFAFASKYLYDNMVRGKRIK